MSKNHLWKRVITFLALGMMAWGLSACYRDAGENVQPTSNRVELNDMPTTPPPPSEDAPMRAAGKYVRRNPASV